MSLHPTEMIDVSERSLVEELLDMAKAPDAFSKSDLGVMLLVAATEIMKLREAGAYREADKASMPAF